MGQLSGVGAPRTTSSPTPTAAGTVVRATGVAAGAKLHFNALIDTAGGANDASISGGITLQRLELVTAS